MSAPYVSQWVDERFQSHDADRCREWARRYPFATLCALLPSGQPGLAHCPALIEGDKLFVHLAAENPFSDALRAGSPVTAVFNGPNCFISTRWYDTVTGPTWNYIAVHASASKVRWVQDLQEVHSVLFRLVERFERTVGEGYMPELTDRYMNGLMPHLTMVEMQDLTWWGVFKLSQNKSTAERTRIARELASLGDDPAAIAAEMDAERLRGR